MGRAGRVTLHRKGFIQAEIYVKNDKMWKTQKFDYHNFNEPVTRSVMKGLCWVEQK